MKNPHGLAGKPSNNRKPEGDKATSYLHIKCRPADKAKWVKAAGGGKLSKWVVSSLNAAAKPD